MTLSSKALRQRVNALESSLIGNPITLTLRDGTFYRLPGDGMLEIFCQALAVISEYQGPDCTNAIPQSVCERIRGLPQIIETVDSSESKSMIQLIQSLWAGPANTQAEIATDIPS
jgi:hypothetical protein